MAAASRSVTTRHYDRFVQRKGSGSRSRRREISDAIVEADQVRSEIACRVRAFLAGRPVSGDRLGGRFYRSVELYDRQDQEGLKVSSSGQLYDDGTGGIVHGVQPRQRDVGGWRPGRQDQSVESAEWPMSQEIREGAFERSDLPAVQQR